MKHLSHKKSQHGQIIVILAIVLVVLLGFTAVAIDGAMIYSDRRFAQNAADAAVLAGAGMAAQYLENQQVKYETFSCSNSIVNDAVNYGVSQAVTRADTNGFTIVPDPAGTLDLGVHVECENIDLGSYHDRYLEFTVRMKNTTNTAFAHLFYNGPVENKVISVVRVHPRTNLGMGYAIAAMGLNCSTGGMFINGNIDVDTTNAGLFSNSCMSFSGTALTVTAYDPNEEGIRFISTLSIAGNPVIDPWPQQAPVRMKQYPVDEPNCASLPSFGSITIGGAQTIDPGRYTSIRMNSSNGVLNLNPGLYCISNDLTVNGGSIVGTGVTFFMPSGDFSVSGNVQVNLSAPTGDTPPAIRGMLIYNSGSGVITLQGTADSSYTGTVYAPNGSIVAGGSSSMLPTLNTQLVSQRVTVGGTTNIDIVFNSDENFQVPAALDLMK